MDTGHPQRHSHIFASTLLGGVFISLLAMNAKADEIGKKAIPPVSAARVTSAALNVDGAASRQNAAPPPLAGPVTPPPPPPGPIGVFGLDIPAPGKLVLSITPTFSNLSGIKMGTRTVWNEYIVSTVPFFLNPQQRVRIIPQNIAARTQIVGLNYGITQDLCVVLNAGMIEKSLEALVFKGTSGIQPLARNYPDTAGLTDFNLSGVYRVYHDDINRIQVSLGVSFPTGSNHAIFNNFVLPNGTASDIRAFYGMQLGTGTYDIMPGIVYAGYLGPWSWGVSYRGRFPLGPNPEGYAWDDIPQLKPWGGFTVNPKGYMWGDLHELNGWAGYSWIPGFTTTFRVSATMQGAIRGWDPEIHGPASPANPLFYGGQRVELFGGGTISGKFIGYENWTLGVEAGLPVYQNLNGPQIMKNWQAGMQLKVKI
ncbi:MAG: alpha-amylase [Hyphomicrobiales bacterium]|nr:MAG: alpha-amylase [Hyphomicrobiales bacterium]